RHDARTDPHGSSRRHVRAVLGGARSVGARSPERHRRKSQLGVHSHAARRDGDAGQSMVQIAKKTQSKVRELAAKVDHVQVPAYYDQIVGDLYLSPEGATSAGSLAKLEEGGGESVLPPQEQKVAALQAPQPLTSFMRSNADWTVNVSLPEAATQFGYRIGDQGSFIDAGFIDALDQRTGSVCPRPISSCRQIRARPSSMSPGATGAASRPISSPSISIRKRRSPRARRKSWKCYGRPGSTSETGTAQCSSISRTSSPIAARFRRCDMAITAAPSIRSISCRRAISSIPTASRRTPRFI